MMQATGSKCAQCLASEVLSIMRFDNGIGTVNATGLVLAVERSGDAPPHRSARKRREPEVRHLDQLKFSMLRLSLELLPLDRLPPEARPAGAAPGAALGAAGRETKSVTTRMIQSSRPVLRGNTSRAACLVACCLSTCPEVNGRLMAL